MTEIATELKLLETGVAAAVVDRDVIRASGPDAIAFLQGQLSQDVAGLPVGQSARSLLLQPQGKVDAWIRLYREADDAVLIDVDAGWGEHVLARLNRFKLRTACEFEHLTGWRMVSLRGPASTTAAPPSGAVAVDATWGSLAGVDLLGEAIDVPTGVAIISTDALEAARIASGLPVMGAELDEGTIPAEAAVVDESASFTKGCYVGQELVARVDSRGSNTPRKLRRVTVAAAVAIPADAVLMVGDTEAGRITSSAIAGADATVALAYVKRAVEPPVTATVVTAAGVEVATAEVLA